MWNNNVPIDRDVRKCIGTISNYKRLEEHLNHPSLQDIKEGTASQLINWTCTSKWFNYNGHDEATSSQHCKDTAWKIRCFTKTLPTLDILNRKFPKLINNVCCVNRSTEETNDHIWLCPELDQTIRTDSELPYQNFEPVSRQIIAMHFR
ncbi:hypothetical protein RhiirA4_451459 [Rhizophagus irregularis]|uniref:Uncharacterized protein n=1 Tax=Rhizophagus irregularis TaxID=588596 RepID=A0A2I1FVR2_9GLOM|nr:hypothetical protein RhiirA4_451459 [Rhizophagus irregularis]